jgi:hypothetical protein
VKPNSKKPKGEKGKNMAGSASTFKNGKILTSIFS